MVPKNQSHARCTLADSSLVSGQLATGPLATGITGHLLNPKLVKVRSTIRVRVKFRAKQMTSYTGGQC